MDERFIMAYLVSPFGPRVQLVRVVEQAMCPMGDAIKREIGWFLSGAGDDTYARSLLEALQ